MVKVLDIPNILENERYSLKGMIVCKLYADSAEEVGDSVQIRGISRYAVSIGSECVTGDWKKGRFTSSGWVWKDEV